MCVSRAQRTECLHVWKPSRRQVPLALGILLHGTALVLCIMAGGAGAIIEWSSVLQVPLVKVRPAACMVQ